MLHLTSLLSFVLFVGDPPLKQQQQVRVGQIVLGVAFGLLCAVLALVLVCAAVTCLKLVKARKRSECNDIRNRLILSFCCFYQILHFMKVHS